MNVLISLHKGYGLGDAIQVSAVLRHVKRYRPEWSTTFQAEAGRACIGRCHCDHVMTYGDPYPVDHIDAEVLITLFDTWHGYTDRPNTRVSSCLRQHFGVDWDAKCGRYQVEVSARATYEALSYLRHTFPLRSGRLVGIHTEGHTAKDRKDLTPMQGEEVCDAIRRMGRIPFSFNNYSGDAETNCALIRQCEAFVGIDSGPAKCASATDTPSLVVWTGHHPAAFHDPAPNTTHLVPRGYHRMEPVCNDPDVVAWFDAHYDVRFYVDDPVEMVGAWLQEVLR